MAFVSASCHPWQRGAVMGAVGTAQGCGAMTGALMGGLLYEHARLFLPGLPESSRHFAAFLNVNHHGASASSAVSINPHYMPFIACAFLLLAAWAIAIRTIKEHAAPCS